MISRICNAIIPPAPPLDCEPDDWAKWHDEMDIRISCYLGGVALFATICGLALS